MWGCPDGDILERIFRIINYIQVHNCSECYALAAAVSVKTIAVGETNYRKGKMMRARRGHGRNMLVAADEKQEKLINDVSRGTT